MGERAIWSGMVTFGLVTIPIKLFSATDSRSISFNQIHAKCKTRIQEKRWCPHCDRSIEWEEVEKGYEYAKGKYVPVTKEDLESIPLPSKNTIAIQSFMNISEIDPIYFEKSYYIEPDEKAERPFSLLIQTLIDKEMVGIGAFTIRTKERLCCLRPVGGVIIVDTLLYPDEIKVDLNSKLPKTQLSIQEKKMAASLVDMMATPFDPSDFKDHYREALSKLIDAKLEGIPVEEVKEPARAATPGSDLMESLKRSLSVIEGGKSTAVKRTAKKPEAREAKATKPKGHVSLVASEEHAKKPKGKRTKKRKAG